ncbi:MAG: glycoside hydrolase family 13 protein [Oscillospiraceae bacterium]|nr:glycoside hydrolase family 13 protein [Oscillospiraceae bacterium]
MSSAIYDSWNTEYKKPFGAIKKGSKCQFTIKLPKYMKLDFAPVMVFYRSGFKERFINMTLQDEVVVNEDGWTSEEENNYYVYTAEFSANHIDVHYYYFAVTIGGIRQYIKRKNRHTGSLDGKDVFQLTVYDAEFKTPDFVKGGVMYQIFPDRFYKSGKEHDNVPADRVFRDDWEGTPCYNPDAKGHVWNNDYFGGDLDGIAEKLPYLKELGVTCVYLNPIFESHENHRYNTANYEHIDPLLGTDEDFVNLCKKAEEMGIGIILDGVFSHTGADSIYFNKFKRYNTAGAYHSKQSQYYPWYTFHNWPEAYDAWWGIDTLPNVKEENPSYLEYICGDDGILQRWLDMGAMGYRLDVADELPDKFLDALRKKVKGVSEDKLIIGEVWEDASNKEAYGKKRRYLLGMQLDSVMNYPFKDSISRYVCGGSAMDFVDEINSILENYPKPSIDVLMNSLSTHDIERAINRFGGENCDGKTKEWMAEKFLTPYEYELGKNRLKVAMVLQFFLPGLPCIYYGDEIGMQGYKDPFNRRCFTWNNIDEDLVNFTKNLTKLRKCSDVFKEGETRLIACENNILSIVRYDVDYSGACVVYVNRSQNPETIAKSQNIFNYNTYDYKSEGSFVKDGILTLPPYGFAFAKVENPLHSSVLDTV